MSWFQFGVTTEAAPHIHRFTFRQPIITGKRAAIAQAAHDAGFDCSNPDKLLHLLDVVVLANNKFGYQDNWDGPVAFQSTLYPDSWTSAHASRKEHVSKVNNYEEFERHPAVPAFGPSAAEIIRDLTAQQKQSTGSNRQPLSERRDSSLNKRSAAAPLPGKPAKRFKREGSSSMHSVTTSQTFTIYEDGHEQHAPARPKTATKVSRPATSKASRNQSHRQRAAQTHQIEAVATGTHVLLAKITNKLQAKVQSLNSDRDSLRVRWEVDRRLQLISITDYLKGLNEYFNQAEAAMKAASSLIEHYII
ncbi:MAG: hypothetical protein Q9182_004085 [Xanthomendoza sp. 2 TL-2023]